MSCLSGCSILDRRENNAEMEQTVTAEELLRLIPTSEYAHTMFQIKVLGNAKDEINPLFTKKYSHSLEMSILNDGEYVEFDGGVSNNSSITITDVKKGDSETQTDEEYYMIWTLSDNKTGETSIYNSNNNTWAVRNSANGFYNNIRNTNFNSIIKNTSLSQDNGYYVVTGRVSLADLKKLLIDENANSYIYGLFPTDYSEKLLYDDIELDASLTFDGVTLEFLSAKLVYSKSDKLILDIVDEYKISIVKSESLEKITMPDKNNFKFEE